MELKEKILSSERVFDGKIVNLRLDTVQLPDGREARREVVEHKGAVAIMPLLDHSRVVMIKQFRLAAKGVLIEIPAGVLEMGETPEECAYRELMEETGFSAGKLTPMFSAYLAPGYSEEMLHTFLAEDLSPAKSDLDDDEFLEVMQVGLDEAADMIASGEIVDAKTVCGVLMAQRIVSDRERS